MALATAYRRIEDIGVVQIVVAELKFRDIEWQTFGPNLMGRTNDAPLEDRPEASDCVMLPQ
jgi:hypothetical protein